MPVVVMNAGIQRILKTFLDNVPLKIFPYKNDRTPKIGDLRSAYTEADFSGYGGRKNATGWSAPGLVATHALSEADSLAWRHNGGGTDNNIYGVCYVDAGDVLLFAERDPNAPVLLDPDHRDYTFKPVLTTVSEYSP